MPVAWFFAPYKRVIGAPRPTRYCAMNDFTAQIWTDNGYPTGNRPGTPQFWSETEILGNHALVKVRATQATLDAIDATTGFVRIPKARLDDSLSDLTAAQKTKINNKLLALGYTQAEIDAKLGPDIGLLRLAHVLRFAATRRYAPRYDAGTDSIVLDGRELAPRLVESVDAVVS
jgi:hypothetical protein